MPLTKPAMMSAFLCPGVGQWVAGQRLLGGVLVLAAVACAVTPLACFLWGLGHPPPCDIWNETAFSCSKHAIAAAWHATVPSLRLGLPGFLVVWAGAVAHAQRLQLP